MAGLNGAEERVDDGLMNLDFSRICRLCLNFSRECVDLRPSNGNRNGARHIIDQIKYCYSIKIDLNEPLPSKICFQCIQILTLFSATKRNIKYSEMMLKNILNIRNANQIINSQSRQGINLSILQRYLQTSDDHQREQEPPVAQDRPTQDNSSLQNLRISPIRLATVQELYRRQNQVAQDDDNQNVPTNSNLSQSTNKLTEKRNVENRKSNTAKRSIEKSNTNIDNPKANTENGKVVENKPTEVKEKDSSDTNSNTVESSSRSKPNCSTSTDLTPQEENVGKSTKTPEDKMKSTNKNPNLANNINRKRSFLIDKKRDLRVKLEILDLKNTKKYLSSSTDALRVSTEGQAGGTSSETTSVKVVKEIGTVIDESNILSPKVKRMRKSIPKG